MSNPLLEQILRSYSVSEEAQAAIALIQLSQAKQQKSGTSSDRKDRILEALFTKRTETVALLNLCRGLLSVFQGYVKIFQRQAPQIHILHQQMVDVTKTFLTMFIKPEHIPEGVSALLKLDVHDRSIQKHDRDLGVGKFAYPVLLKARQDKSNHYWLDELYANLRLGFVSAASKILQLPLKNKTLRCLSVLDPHMQGHSQTVKVFRYLSALLPNVISDEDTGSLHMELNALCVDKQVTALSNQYEESMRIDTDFWSHVFNLKTFDNQRYPVLSKLVCSLLTSFSGPLIEGTFNIMGDIIEEDRSHMNLENYEAVAIIKTALKQKETKTHKMKITPVMKKCAISAYGRYQTHLKDKKEQAEKRKQEKLEHSIQKLKQEKAKKLSRLVLLKKRIVSKGGVGTKRKNPEGDSSNSRVWKRIKNVK